MVLRGTVLGLTRYGAKGVPGETPESVRLIAGLGMEGDRHARGGERQLSLLPLEARHWIDGHCGEPGLCFGRFRENVLLDLPSRALAPGVRLAIGGGAVLEISGGKDCFGQCPLRRGDCVLRGLNPFAVVVRGGTVRAGDCVETEKEEP